MTGHGASLAASTRPGSVANLWQSARSELSEEGESLRLSIQPEIDAQTMRNLVEMGFSKERINRAKQQLPLRTEPTFENMLQALFAQTMSPPSSRPSSAALLPERATTETSTEPKAFVQELIDMGFPSKTVHAVTATLDANASLEQALEAMLAFVPEQEASEVQHTEATTESPGTDNDVEGRKVLLQYIASLCEDVDTADVWRLLVLIDAALKQNLLTDEQRLELHGEMQNLNLEVVKDFLTIIQVRNVPGLPLVEGEAPWECSICFSDQEELGWRCPEGHQYCHTCMGHHVEATIFPNCPHVGCGFGLEEADLLAIHVSGDRLESFRQAKLRKAVDSLGGSSGEDGAQEVVIRCQRSECSNAVTVVAGGPRLRYACECGAPAFCTHCRQTPYHYHADCSEVQALRQSYLDWVMHGREHYSKHFHGASKRTRRFLSEVKSYTASLDAHRAHVQSLRDAMARHRDLERDEAWKSRHCRLCPGCRRPLEKTGGCDSMVCGQNYHGGNEQPGCGMKFSWSEALPYVAATTATSGEADLPSAPGAPQRPAAVRGADAFHPFADCSLCKCEGILGPLFRCIHCESFSICVLCEERASELHNADHVFEIMYESNYDWSQVRLPIDMPVRIVRHKNSLPQHPRITGDGFHGSIKGFQPMIRGSVAHRRAIALGQSVPVGEYDICLLDGTSERLTLSAHFVEPLVDSRKDAQMLIDGVYDASKN